MKTISSLLIQDGSVNSEQRDFKFHQFVEERTLTVYILLPGVKHESLRIKIHNENEISVSAYLWKYYRMLFKGDKIDLRGEVIVPIKPKSLSSEYFSGILKIKFVRKFKELL